MSERAIYCPRCGHMHTGICPLATAKPAPRTKPEPVPPDSPLITRPEAFVASDGVTHVGPLEFIPSEIFTFNVDAVTDKFDKRAYQKEYMRKRREEARASRLKPEGKK